MIPQLSSRTERVNGRIMQGKQGKEEKEYRAPVQSAASHALTTLDTRIEERKADRKLTGARLAGLSEAPGERGMV